MDIDAEFGLDVVLDGVAEGDDFGAGGTSTIDEDQGLFVVNTRTS